IDEALAGLAAGEVAVVVGLSSELEPLLEQYPGLAMSDESITGQATRSFVLGTNQLGQAVMSRFIWVTPSACVTGFSASVCALATGLPLGLSAGFWSGPIERVLTLIMDSLYSFPGLILAIAITSVLGPGMFNVVIAIATLYVPTY